MSDNSSSPFQEYASTYDSLYRSKDYQAECDFIEAVLAKYGGPSSKECSILDLGCGTGGHAIPLAARGHQVHGVDLSEEMLGIARAKVSGRPEESRLSFQRGDIQNFALNKEYDSIVSMFAVVSYLTENKQLRGLFECVSKHLKNGGVFLCDFWYGPAVLRDPPVARQKEFKDGENKNIIRTATPTIDWNTNITSIKYELIITDLKSGDVQKVSETHQMRYLFLQELALFGDLVGLDLIHSCNCCDLTSPPSEKTWTASAIFKKR